MQPVRSRSGRCAVAVAMALILAAGCSGGEGDATGTAESAPSEPVAAGARGFSMCGHWSDRIQSEPSALKQSGSPGFFVWNDYAGWHVRVRSGPDGERFHGNIAASHDLDSVRLVPPDAGVVELRDNVVRFSINGTTEPRGFDLTAPCPVNRLQLTLLIGDRPAAPEEIFLGSEQKGLSATFTEERT